MTRHGGILRAVSVAGLAFAGLVGGHALGYAIAIPDVHHRSTLITETGHGYLPGASWVAAVLGLSAVAAGVAAAYVRRTPHRRHQLKRAAVAMACGQASAFVLVEFVERLAAGAPFQTLSPRLLAVGIVVQVVVGIVAAFVLAGLRRLGAALRSGGRSVAVVPARSFRLPEAVRAHATASFAVNHVRGPPAVAA